MGHQSLILSTFCFLAAFSWTLFALGRGQYRSSRFHLTTTAFGFAGQTWFLYERGLHLGRCPLTNAFEVFVFLSWSLVLIYLLVGSSYRLSLIGLLTSPLVFLIQTVVLLTMEDLPSGKVLPAINPWVSMHAAISMIAYGAFGLAAAAGIMYLLQSWQLKTRRLSSFFFELPPISELATVVTRLLIVGFGLLSVGLIGVALASHGKPAHPEGILEVVRAIWPLGIWAIYAVILVIRLFFRPSPRRMAGFAIAGFVLALSVLLGIDFISDKGHF